MSDIIEEFEVVLNSEFGLTPQEFAEEWNNDPECSAYAFARVRPGSKTTSMGHFQLWKEVIELIPQWADNAAKAAAGILTKETISMIVQRWKEKKEQKKASKEFAEKFLTVTKEDHERRRTFFLNGKFK